MSTKHTKTTLDVLKRSALVSICDAFALSTDGDTDDLIDRILKNAIGLATVHCHFVRAYWCPRLLQHTNAFIV